MSQAPPPGTELPSSLPARPPNSTQPRPTTTTFQPRSVKSGTANTWDVYKPPTASFGQQLQQAYGNQQIPGHHAPGYPAGYSNAGPPSISGYQAGAYASQTNVGNGGGVNAVYGQSGYDPELAAQIANWQNSYGGPQQIQPTQQHRQQQQQQQQSFGVNGKPQRPGNANNIPLGQRANAPQLSAAEINATVNPDTKIGSVVTDGDGKQKTVVRSGGGKTWQDNTLLEWDPSHPRLFIGNLAGEVTDDSLLKAFARYPSVVKARVIREKRTTKSKGFGFVSFTDSDDYFMAAKEMQGKYIGSHPVLIKRSTTEIKPTVQQPKNQVKKKAPMMAPRQVKSGGIEKKEAKKKNGLKILG